MAEQLSPGTIVTEIDASTIVPTVSNSIGVFAGDFQKGPIGINTLVTSVNDLLSFYGPPSDTNYNDFYQAYNFLQYGNKLLLSRASNITGSSSEVPLNVSTGIPDGTFTENPVGFTTTAAVTQLTFVQGDTITATGTSSTALVQDAQIAFLDAGGIADLNNIYTVATALYDVTGWSITLADASLGADIVSGAGLSVITPSGIFIDVPVTNSTYIDVSNPLDFSVNDIICFEDVTGAGADITEQYVILEILSGANQIRIDTLNRKVIPLDSAIFKISRSMNGVYEAVATGGVTPVPGVQFSHLSIFENAGDFEAKFPSISASGADTRVKFIARSAGAWCETLEIAMASPSAFGALVPSMAFDGVLLDDLFEYAPTGTEVGIVIRDGLNIVETWTVDFDKLAKDHNNKSTYIENVINNGSSYIFVKEFNAGTKAVGDYLWSVNNIAGGTTIKFNFGSDSQIVQSNLIDAYDVFANKEEIDIDIVIGNELDAGASIDSLCNIRKDCLGFIGANYSDVVGKKSAIATANLLTWRKTGGLNFNNMFIVSAANYKYQYDRYNDKYRWVNIAGDIAGLRAQTSTNRASWWASAGLERGQIKNVTKLAFNPTQGQRDMLYKNSLNPVVSFPGQGTVMWGQKTVLDKPSSFDRANVRGLFNTLERALGKMAKYQVMEFNDNFTRNRIISMIKPYLSGVQSGRGIQEFLAICDESNNTADVISRNQLIVDIYIKPTYVAEFIQLRFTNAGTNSFAQIIGG